MIQDKLTVIQKRLTKLMALSASPIQAEAELALAKCKELMEKYDITSIDIDPISLQVQTESRFVKGKGKRLPKWQGILAVDIAKVFDTLVVSTRNSQEWEGITFIGGKSDVLIVTDLFIRLRRVIGKMGSEYADEHPIEWASKDKVKDSYCIGVVITVSGRLSAVFQEKTTALSVVKEEEVLKHMQKEFGNVNQAKIDPMSSSFEAAMIIGKEDGKDVVLQKVIK